MGRDLGGGDRRVGRGRLRQAGVLRRRGRRRREAEQRQQEQLAKAEKRLADARANLAALREQETLLRNPDDDVSDLVVVGIVSRCVSRADGPIQIERFSLADNSLVLGAPAAAGTPESRRWHVLALTGVGKDSLAIASFAAGLRSSGLFAAVDRKQTAAPRGTKISPWRLSSSANFEGPQVRHVYAARPPR